MLNPAKSPGSQLGQLVFWRTTEECTPLQRGFWFSDLTSWIQGRAGFLHCFGPWIWELMIKKQSNHAYSISLVSQNYRILEVERISDNVKTGSLTSCEKPMYKDSGWLRFTNRLRKWIHRSVLRKWMFKRWMSKNALPQSSPIWEICVVISLVKILKLSFKKKKN